MKEIQIKLSLTEDIKDFVKITSQYAYDIDMCQGRYVIDAKSILGIFCMDMSKPVTVRAYCNDCDDLFQELEAYRA